MYVYAQIRDGFVVAVTETHSPVISADMIALQTYDISLLGMEYVNGAFQQPAVTPYTHLTKRSFWNRFPQANEVAMRAIMAQGSPALLAGQFATLNTRVESSPYVDVALPQTIAGVNSLAAETIPTTIDIDGQTLPLRLTAEQVAAILAPPIGDEVYGG